MQNDTSNIYLPEGSNGAAIQPILDLKDPTIDDNFIRDNDITKQFRDKYDEKINDKKETWREMICAGQICALFIEGEQILKINSFNGMPSIVKPNMSDPQHIKSINKMQFYSTTWQDKWRSSKPDMIVSPWGSDDRAITQARKANAVVDHLESKFHSPFFDLNEGLNVQIWGWYGRFVRPDHTSKAFSTFKDILGEKETAIGKAYGKCDECGYVGDGKKDIKRGAGDFIACPECESLEFEYEPPIMQMTSHVTGQEKIFLPDIVMEAEDFPAVRFDISKRAELSSWYISEKRVGKAALRRILGNIRFPEGEGGNEFGLDVLASLAERGSAMDGRSSVADTSKVTDNQVTLTRMYLGPDDLFDIRVPSAGSSKTVEGKELPKGKRYSEIYPNGACIIGTGGMSLILGIYDEQHADALTTGVYHMKANSGTGRGVTDSVEVQKQFNRRYSQVDNFMANRATPATLVPENAIENKYKKLLNNPRAIIPIKLDNFPNVRNVRDLIAPLQGESVPGDLVSMTFDRLEAMMQTSYHITNFGGASPQGINNNTATYAQINDANSEAIFSPILSIKADVGLQTIKKAFYLWVKYTPEARFIPFKTPTKAGSVGLEIAGKDVDGEYQWSYVPGSEAPKTKFSEMQKRVSFFQQFQGGVSGWLEARNAAPKEIAELERDFDVNFETESYDLVAESCRNRFETARKELDIDQIRQAEQFGVPPELSYLDILMELQPSMLITEGDLDKKALWFQALLDTEEGWKMSNEERQLVSSFIFAFKELLKGQTIATQRDMVEIQIESQAPAREAQEADQQAQIDAQQQAQQGQVDAQQQQQELAMTGEAARVVNENEQADAERQHSKGQQDQQHLMDLATMQHEKEMAQNATTNA